MGKQVADNALADDIKAILGRFDAGIQTKNWDAAYVAGNEFVAKYPDNPAIISFIAVPLGTVGLYQSYPPAKNYKYNSDTIKYANLALSQIKAGKQSIKKDKNGNLLPDTYGVYDFECKKDDCISELTYALGYINYYALGKKQEGIGYYYQVTKLPGRNKSNPGVYGTIGDSYYDTVKTLVTELKAMYADVKDTDPDEVKAKKDTDIKAKVALMNGYAERAMDAYSRAYTFAKADPKADKQGVDALYKILQNLYTVRFQKQDGIDQWISATVTKPLPDPTSTVAPITDPETSTSGSTSTGPATAKPTPTPATTTPIKPATNTTPTKPGTVKVGGKAVAGPSETTTAVKAKAPAVKPVVKRKPTQ